MFIPTRVDKNAFVNRLDLSYITKLKKNENYWSFNASLYIDKENGADKGDSTITTENGAEKEAMKSMVKETH